MKVSILIPTYNAEPYILDLLGMLEAQELPKNVSSEIIIVDSSSTDRTVEIVKENTTIKLIQIKNKDFNHGGTRNLLAQYASGDFLLYMTQDAIPVDTLLVSKLLESLLKEKEKVAICFARQIPRMDAKDLEIFARNYNYPSTSLNKDINSLKTIGIKTFFNSNVCSMYETKTFKELNGFPEKIILNEDMVMASKVINKGYIVRYEAEAKVYHSHNYSLSQQFKRYFDIGMAFNETCYLLENASNEKEGFKMVKGLLTFLFKTKKPYLIPYAIIEQGVKYLGYGLGKKNNLIPLYIKKHLSAYSK